MAGALVFTLSGLVCGYFIWRKGHMQMVDAEIEVKRSEQEMGLLRDDLSMEEKEVEDRDSAPLQTETPGNGE